VREIGEAFQRVGYTVQGVRELLGPVAGAALARDEIVPALRETGDGSPLETLTRLFWLQVPVPAKSAGVADALVAAGLAERSGDELRPLLHVEPVEGVDGEGHIGYVVSDLKVRPGSGGVVRPDHVVGAGGASGGLARLTVVHSPVDSALDLGTGCGVQALHLASGRAGRITATDVNPRALALARMSAALSGIDGVEFLAGSLLEPVAGRRFDLIVSNPPFVIAPPGEGPRYVYRESGLSADEFCRRLVVESPRLLDEGGQCRFLANWLQVKGVPWDERVGAWAEESGCDAWIVQRDVQDPAEYAELWLRDSCEVGSPAYRGRYEAWLDYFERQEATGVGFGWIALRRPERGRPPVVRVEELRHAVDQPVGACVHRVLDGLVAAGEFSTACGRGGIADRLLRTADGVVQEQIGPPGAEDPERILLRQDGGLRRAAGVGTVEAALAGVCDGTLSLGPLLDAIAQLLGLDAGQVRAHAEAVLPELIADGFFEVMR
jgi:methylase of polypeptide subunit release factors